MFQIAFAIEETGVFSPPPALLGISYSSQYEDFPLSGAGLSAWKQDCFLLAL
jgi:hypothetical protein